MRGVIGRECEQASISVHNKIAPETLPVLADSDRITQVLLNLLANARHHTPAGGTVTIGARAEGKDAAAWVCDTGAGIDGAYRSHFCDRTYRAERARAVSTRGSRL